MSNALPLSATDLARSVEDRKGQRAELDRQFKEMSEVMIREEGLLNHSQGALFLDITPARVTELVKLGILKRYDFLGRTYISVKEVRARRAEDIKAGRPPRSVMQRIVASAKVTANADLVQLRQGGFLVDKAEAKRRRKKK
jgi:hypothetical protein